MRRLRWPLDGPDTMVAAGGLLVCVGVGMVYIPAAVVACGIALVLASLILGADRARKESLEQAEDRRRGDG